MSNNDHILLSDNDSDDYLDDEAFFEKNSKYAGFLSEMNLDTPSSQKRPRKEEDDEEQTIEKEYEEQPGYGALNDDDEYLPTIHEDGTIRVSKKPKLQKNEDEEEEEEGKPAIPTKALTKAEKRRLKRQEKKERERQLKESQELQEKEKQNKKTDEEEDNEMLNESEEKEEETNEELTPEQLAKKKEKHFNEAMTDIAVQCELILENPNKGVTRRRNEISPLNAVVRYLDDDNPQIRILATLSLMKVFNDILPNYPIHLATKTEKEVRVSKDVRSIRQYEESLMTFYSMYIKKLSNLIHHYKKQDPQECKAAIQALCTILRNHYFFNLADTVCKAIVPFVFVKEDDIASIVVDCLTDVFRGDSQGSISFSIIQQIARLIKNKNYLVHPRAIQLFLSLPLKESLSESDELGIRSKKKKAKSEVDKIMQESEGPDPEVYKAFQKDILQEVLLVYFHILKLPNNSSLIHVVLEGLAKFGMLLNSHIITDLLSILKEVLIQHELPMESILQCVLAAFRLIQIVSATLNIDESIFINKLYEIRFDFIHIQYYSLIPDYLECIDLCFLSRKELLHERVAAFIKALMTLSLQLPTKYSVACISLARALLLRYPMYSSLLFNEEGRCISGVFNMNGNTPDQVNAHATTLWEICLLLHISDPTILSFVKEMEKEKSMRMEQNWREMLKKDYSHRIFTAEKLTKKKVIREDTEDEDDMDVLLDEAFGSDKE